LVQRPNHHIHFQVYLNNGLLATSQLAFPQTSPPVSTTLRSTAHMARTRPASSFAQDNVFSDGTTGEMLTLAGDVSTGYRATLTAGVAA
jgi:hypothetical protein